MNRPAVALAIVAAALGSWGAVSAFEEHETRARAEGLRVWAKLLLDAGLASCLPREALVSAAQSNGWEVRDDTVPGRNAVRVLLEPALPGADPRGLQLVFDSKGCLSR